MKLVITVLIALSLSACDSSGDVPNTPDAGTTQTISCMGDDVCPEGSYCDTQNFCDSPCGSETEMCAAVCTGRCVARPRREPPLPPACGEGQPVPCDQN